MIVWQQKSTAFGETLVDPASRIENNLRFPGQYYDLETSTHYYDPETHTHYNYFRDYDPSIGRYAQGDPIGLEGGSTPMPMSEGIQLIGVVRKGWNVDEDINLWMDNPMLVCRINA